MELSNDDEISQRSFRNFPKDMLDAASVFNVMDIDENDDIDIN